MGQYSVVEPLKLHKVNFASARGVNGGEQRSRPVRLASATFCHVCGGVAAPEMLDLVCFKKAVHNHSQFVNVDESRGRQVKHTKEEPRGVVVLSMSCMAALSLCCSCSSWQMTSSQRQCGQKQLLQVHHPRAVHVKQAKGFRRGPQGQLALQHQRSESGIIQTAIVVEQPLARGQHHPLQCQPLPFFVFSLQCRAGIFRIISATNFD
mmetsp:Transcript_2424/g.4425  ORF Transcript_2424/g.4425 Transcript_2424/m.4425 type:complete len:207 (+) Transcript_2424:187-807(+)